MLYTVSRREPLQESSGAVQVAPPLPCLGKPGGHKGHPNKIFSNSPQYQDRNAD